MQNERLLIAVEYRLLLLANLLLRVVALTRTSILGRKEGWGLGGAWMETCWLYGAVYSKILAGAGGGRLPPRVQDRPMLLQVGMKVN